MSGFKAIDTLEIPRLSLKATKLKHSLTGLTHLHVQRPDRNNVFSLAFKTNAPDKTGVPHILEHTTLCGSKNYPVRDPFFKMQTRSLANFMNALTGPDYTYYPFATTNIADFNNLQKVYIDSVFSPLLRENDFKQEGWRLEHQQFDDPNTPIELKGVVFNEMKGQFSMPAYYFYKEFLQAIYPSLNYSAGDPNCIPDLKYEDLLKFHQEKYAPSNCFTFSYGDFSVDQATKNLSAHIETLKLSPSAEKKQAPELLPVALGENKVLQHTTKGPLDPIFDESRQHKISLTWYVGEPNDTLHTLAWRVLGMLLTDGHASPFYQSLIDSGLAPEFSVNTGFDEMPGKLLFTVGVQGLTKENIAEFRNAVNATLTDIAENGFEQSRLDAIIHSAELSEREIDVNFGMSLLSRVVQRAFSRHGDVMEVLDAEKLLNDFKAKIQADPDFFKREVSKLIDLPCFEFCMDPNIKFDEERQALEKQVLQRKVDQLSAKDKEAVLSEGIELAKVQAAEDDVSVLPTVVQKDIGNTSPDFPVSTKQVFQSELIERVTPTQGISYVSVLRNFSDLKKSLVPYLPLYAESLLNLGTKDHDMATLEDLIKLRTGGIRASAGTAQKFKKPLELEVGYGVSGLDSNNSHMYSLLAEIATKPLLHNIQKLKPIIEASAAGVIDALISSGHSYALGRASAGLSARRALGDRLSGFENVRLLKRLSSLNESQLQEEIVPKFEEIHNSAWNARAGLTCSPGTEALEANEKNLNEFLRTVNAGKYENGGVVEDYPLLSKRSLLPVANSQVSFVGCSIRGPTFDSPDSAAMTILSSLLTHKYLHSEIREKGGAYGGGASFNSLAGLFSMYSYRDPSPDASLATMATVGKWASGRAWSVDDVTEGQISVFQSIDAPMSPRAEIHRALTIGLTHDQVQQRRDHLLAVTPEDLNRVANQYLGGLEDLEQASVCIIGAVNPKEGWQEESLS